MSTAPHSEPLFEQLFAGQSEANRGEQIFRRFRKFHAANPGFFRLFVQFTFELINAGHEHGSADMVCHRIRWESAIKLSGEEPVRVNNDYVSLFSRLFSISYPAHSLFFETRRRVSVEHAANPLDPAMTYAGAAGNEAELVRRLTELAHLNSPDFQR